MRIFILLLGFFMISDVVLANCFRNHLREAIKINEERKPRYSLLSNAQSEAISEKLISFEKRLLFFSFVFANFDYKSQLFEPYGINITCDDYVSMSTVNKFNDFWPEGAPNVKDYVDFNLKQAKRLLYSAYFDYQDLKQVLSVTKDLLKEVEKELRYNCMIRHALESIARIAYMAPIQEATLEAKGEAGAIALAREMVYGHIFMLDTFNELDKMAKPLNTQGIPILCQDVPQIPLGN